MPSRFCTMAFLLLISSGCAGAQPTGPAPVSEVRTVASHADAQAYRSELAGLAEMERRGQYASGLGLYESGLRERIGDRSGAVFAAYKDLAYGYSRGAVTGAEIEARLARLEESAKNAGSDDSAVLSAIAAIRLYASESWTDAAPALAAFGVDDGSADSMADWMALAAKIEERTATAEDVERYSLMQARYALLPEYWLRFYHAQEQVELKRDSTDRCVSLAPSGPFAASGREELADSYGLGRKSGASLLVRSEIDGILSLADRSGDCEKLAELLPVLGLPDNPLTLYAVDALRELCASDACRAWLRKTAGAVGGRAAERLMYAAGR